ncbi:MAG TPA: acylphosphatase [Candidatus Limnocylindrales bacterium]|nr:acylphosphatase [Candidatus Limnocylindrales bacterium]
MVARRYRITGRVQGVGYRNFVEHTAGKLNVDGYVRNRRDGSVEVFAMGTNEELHKLRKALERGPIMAQVGRVSEEATDVEAKYVGNFTVEYTE